MLKQPLLAKRSSSCWCVQRRHGNKKTLGFFDVFQGFLLFFHVFSRNFYIFPAIFAGFFLGISRFFFSKSQVTGANPPEEHEHNELGGDVHAEVPHLSPELPELPSP